MSLSWVSLEDVDAEELLSVTRTERQSERVPIYCPAKLSFGTVGIEDRRIISGYVLNMSAAGALVEVGGPLVVGAEVRLHSNELLTGIAIVRHSTRKLWRFRIGLEFERSLRGRLFLE